MSVQLFILGRPGTGKSRAARHIVELAKKHNLSVKRINDFCILQEMCDEEEHRQKFDRQKEQPGFDVVDPSVLDIALEEVQTRARDAMQEYDIVIIEFARDNYVKALSKFSSSFFEDAFFIFLDSDVSMCIERIRLRAAVPSTPDDYPISNKIFSSYYKRRVFPTLLKAQLVLNFALRRCRVLTINNSSTLDQFITEITDAFYLILDTTQSEQHQVVLQPFVPSTFEKAKKMVESASEHATKVGVFFL